jgi:hypothetical protein
MKEKSLISLVIFTCEGREHLIKKMTPSFKKFCDFEFTTTILVADGPVSSEVVDMVNPNLLIQHPKRQGYVQSIIDALKVIETEYFFWLEDDFEFKQAVPILDMFNALNNNNNWAGVFLSRKPLLNENDFISHYYDKFYLPKIGYSVSPTLCRTSMVKSAFKALMEYPKSEETKLYGFETFINDFYINSGYAYAIIDPGITAHVDHIGILLESTAREFHMINSIDKTQSSINKEYISGFGYHQTITFWNKFFLIPKLFIAFFNLSFKLFGKRYAYDFATRIYFSYLRKFK